MSRGASLSAQPGRIIYVDDLKNKFGQKIIRGIGYKLDLFTWKLSGWVSFVADSEVVADDEVAWFVHVTVHPPLLADLLLD